MSKTNMINVLLGLLAVAFISLVLLQTVEMRALQERAKVLQDQVAAQEKKYNELRKQMEAEFETLERVQRLRLKNERKGDHWLPGEFERLRDIWPALPT